jgi:CRP/FNR family transcriptional regulator, cyclic AMP receptor protein
MRGIAELLDEIEVLSGLEPDHRELIAGCGTNAIFADGERLLREGDPATTFYAIRHGTAAIEVARPAGSPLVIETLHERDVLGWSWLFEPYVNHFDARAVGDLRVIAFDGACLRGKCEADHDLGFELMRRFADLICERLQATRLRLLDVYGRPAATAEPR